MPVEDDSDLLGILEDWDTAVYTPSAYPHPSSKSVSISGIFDRTFGEHNSIEGSWPTFFCRVSDVPSVANGDKLTIRSIEYRVVEKEPDGQGAITLLLETV